MKRTDSPHHRWLLISGIVIAPLAGMGGHFKGNADGREASITKSISPGHVSLTADAPVTSTEPRKHISTTSPAALAKIHHRLWEIWRESSSRMMEPEAMAETWRLVTNMSSPQIAAFLQSLPAGAEQMGVVREMRTAILSCWILLDGPAALACMGTSDDFRTRENSDETVRAVMEWTTDQPDAAFAWMSDESLAPDQKKRAAHIRLNSLMVLVKTDPDRAFQELTRLKPDDVSAQLKLWADTDGENPEIRKRLLDNAAATGRPGDLAQVRAIILRNLAEKDLAAARDFVDSQSLTDRERQTLDLYLTLGRARQEPKSAYDDWLATNDATTGIPRPISFGISSWMASDSDQTIQWLDGQPPGEKRDALYADSIPALAGFVHFEKAAEIAAGIDSPALRAAALHALEVRWSLVRPGAANQWRQGLSAEDRHLLEK